MRAMSLIVFILLSTGCSTAKKYTRSDMYVACRYGVLASDGPIGGNDPCLKMLNALGD